MHKQKRRKMETAKERNNIVRFAKRLVKLGQKNDMALVDAFNMCRQIERLNHIAITDPRNDETIIKYDPKYFEFAHTLVKDIRLYAGTSLKKNGSVEMLELYKKILLFDAPYDFDSYCTYIEMNREKEKKFYLPRRPQLLPMVQAMQRLAEKKTKLLTISCPPGIGKTTIAIFFLTWLGGRNPELSILGGSHSNSFLKGVYDEVLRVITPGGEYLWNDVFPNSPLVDTNAKDMRIDLETKKRFQTFEFSSVGSGNAGKVRASNLLYCDDLVDGIETALSSERLEKLWQQYYTDLRQRKIGDCAELHIATHWSVHDVISRLKKRYQDDQSCEFISFPAIDEEGNSLWDYPYKLGFTTEFFREQKRIMDRASWEALYMNQPIEREGLLYYDNELRRYFELPDREPDNIIGVCDTKNTGADYYSMPVAYQYGNDFYIERFVYDNGNPEVVEPKIIETMLSAKIKFVRFESNAAGGRIAQSIQEKVKKRGGITKITTKWNQKNKETRIIAESAWVKEHCLFKDESVYENDHDYREAMKAITSYTMIGKNKHDDAVDSLAMLSDYVQSSYANKVEILKRIF